MNKILWQRVILVAALSGLLSGCQLFGMAGAARITGETFDDFECLARDFKGERPCPEAVAEE